MIDIAMNETPTTFNVYQFFDETIMGHISNNFGLDMHVKIGSFDSMIDFLADGFLTYYSSSLISALYFLRPLLFLPLLFLFLDDRSKSFKSLVISVFRSLHG